MIKNFSKNKITHPLSKKNNELAKTMRKNKRTSCKENHPMQKFNQTTSSIKKIKSSHKNYQKQRTLRSKSSSPLEIEKSKKVTKQVKKDEKFIDKLFSKNNRSTGTEKCFVEGLIQKMIPKGNYKEKQKLIETNYLTDLSRQSSSEKNMKLYEMISKQNTLIKNFNNQTSELKLYLTNFIFKIFDLNIIYRKSTNIKEKDLSSEFDKKMQEVVSYIDSLVRQLKLQSKLKTHCEILSNNYVNKQEKARSRCHTQSLKIPIETYIDSVKYNKLDYIQNTIPQQEQKDSLGEMIEFISRKNSQSKDNIQETIIAQNQYIPQKAHELRIKVGDRVTILKQISNNKVMGVNNGTVGYFPKRILT